MKQLVSLQTGGRMKYKYRYLIINIPIYVLKSDGSNSILRDGEYA